MSNSTSVAAVAAVVDSAGKDSACVWGGDGVMLDGVWSSVMRSPSNENV